MPLDRIVLIAVAIAAGLGALVYGGLLLFGASQLGPFGLIILIPAAVVVYVCFRVLRDRIGDAEDDYYDSIEK